MRNAVERRGRAAQAFAPGCGTAASTASTTASGVTPSAMPAKLTITRCRSTSLATARTSSGATEKRPREERPDLAAQEERLRAARRGAERDVVVHDRRCVVAAGLGRHDELYRVARHGVGHRHLAHGVAQLEDLGGVRDGGEPGLDVACRAVQDRGVVRLGGVPDDSA